MAQTLQNVTSQREGGSLHDCRPGEKECVGSYTGWGWVLGSFGLNDYNPTWPPHKGAYMLRVSTVLYRALRGLRIPQAAQVTP